MSNIYKEIVKQHIAQSTKDLAGKPRLTKEDLEAGVKFAKEKVRPINEYFSNPRNVKDFQDMLAKLNS
ncbi:MAG: hypothetical protein N4A45_12765 [Flavobacteriales bacterium]|jgi:hypothetical protein|nr:hypothetical protein [Flavobacteriales bacterium]